MTRSERTGQWRGRKWLPWVWVAIAYATWVTGGDPAFTMGALIMGRLEVEWS